MKIPRSLLMLSAMLVSLVTPTSAFAQADGIHVSGLGEVEVEPDMGRLTLQVTRDGQDAAELKRGLDDVTGKVLQLTRSLDIAPEDVTAAAVNIHPRHRRNSNQSIIDGVTASRTIAVTLRNLDSYGALMNGALEIGVNSVSRTTLDTSRRKILEDQALDLAMADARTAAQRVAKGFSVRVGRLLNVQVGRQGVHRQRVGAMLMEASTGGDFSPGQLLIRQEVNATFAIESN